VWRPREATGFLPGSTRFASIWGHCQPWLSIRKPKTPAGYILYTCGSGSICERHTKKPEKNYRRLTRDSVCLQGKNYAQAVIFEWPLRR
jgi:hypothetical protein